MKVSEARRRPVGVRGLGSPRRLPAFAGAARGRRRRAGGRAGLAPGKVRAGAAAAAPRAQAGPVTWAPERRPPPSCGPAGPRRSRLSESFLITGVN